VPLETIEDFNALAKEGRATIADARRFLERSKRAIEHLPLDERRAAAAKVGGGVILRWLMDQETFEFKHEFSDALCWFIHAECPTMLSRIG
jgi:hypothetical protein